MILGSCCVSALLLAVYSSINQRPTRRACGQLKWCTVDWKQEPFLGHHWMAPQWSAGSIRTDQAFWTVNMPGCLRGQRFMFHRIATPLRVFFHSSLYKSNNPVQETTDPSPSLLSKGAETSYEGNDVWVVPCEINCSILLKCNVGGNHNCWSRLNHWTLAHFEWASIQIWFWEIMTDLCISLTW